MSGWIKLHRTISEWQWSASPNHLALFITLLIKANYKTTKWRNEEIKPGQLLTGRKQLSDWSGLSEMQVRTVLNDLKSTNEITIKTTNKFSIISITNWESYQEDNQENNQQITNKQPTNNQQITTSKKFNNIKKEKKERNIINKSPLAFLFPETDEIQNWLLTGKPEIQERLLKDHSHHVLAEEVNKAYMWQLSKSKRKADMFLVNWLSNKKSAVFMPNQAQKPFSTHDPSNDITPEEIARAKELGIL